MELPVTTLEMGVQAASAIIVFLFFLYIWPFRNRACAIKSLLEAERHYPTFRKGLLLVLIGITLHFSGSLFITASYPAAMLVYCIAYSFVFGGLVAHLMVFWKKLGKGVEL